jgi:hypothetical protein
MRRRAAPVQHLRIFLPAAASFAGTPDARARNMRADESWTLPLHIIMWATMVIGVIMAMAVIMMH